MTNTAPTEYNLAVISAGTSDPSSTRMLADRMTTSVTKAARDAGASIRTHVIDLRELTDEIGAALVTGLKGPGLEDASKVLGEADGIIAVTPVYKAEPSGLFSSFIHVLDSDLLIGKPVALGATAGTARHALVVDGQMRSLFAFLRTLTVPTSVFAASEDWNDSALSRRVDRAAFELWVLIEAGFATRVREASWSKYQHSFGSAGGTETSVDFDTDLMKLAAGGSLVS